MKQITNYIEEALHLNKDSGHKIKCNTNGDLKREVLKKIIGKETDYNDLDVSEITDFSHIFEDQDITEIDISEWDVSKAETMRGMFQNCKYLRKTGNLKNWNVVNVKDFSWMFNGCKNLINIGDLSSWNINKDQKVHGMFNDTKKLSTIGNIKNWKLNIGNWDVFSLSKINPQPSQTV